MRYIIFLSVSMFLNWIVSCSGSPGNKSPLNADTSAAEQVIEPDKRYIRISSPEENAELILNNGFSVIIATESKNNPADSVRVWFDGILAGVMAVSQEKFELPPALVAMTGRKALKLTAYYGGRPVQSITRILIVFSDKSPQRNGYRVIKEYPHDREAFTQGLVYHGGVLYEGTGQEARSSLRKVDLETGQVLSQLNLEPHLFGEGIAIADNRIFQLTWQSKVGFVYDLSTFKLLNRIYYQTEGWGLTTMGDRLVMSDGTNMLYIVDPGSFTVLSTLEVYDNQSKVSDLNELEFIKGEIWANIWQKDLIARIDPLSGRVKAYIDLKGILKDPGTDTRVNVLNGIAWDSESDRIFVTGKNWPKLFHIWITE